MLCRMSMSHRIYLRDVCQQDGVPRCLNAYGVVRPSTRLAQYVQAPNIELCYDFFFLCRASGEFQR